MNENPSQTVSTGNSPFKVWIPFREIASNIYQHLSVSIKQVLQVCYRLFVNNQYEIFPGSLPPSLPFMNVEPVNLQGMIMLHLVQKIQIYHSAFQGSCSVLGLRRLLSDIQNLMCDKLLFACMIGGDFSGFLI